ncbi:hypothetical protein JXA40_06145 [bacterium]|nr:hypothetical protein [candidate division CSSED10-310 bacterium]
MKFWTIPWLLLTIPAFPAFAGPSLNEIQSDINRNGYTWQPAEPDVFRLPDDIKENMLGFRLPDGYQRLEPIGPGRQGKEALQDGPVPCASSPMNGLCLWGLLPDRTGQPVYSYDFAEFGFEWRSGP